MMWRFPVLSKNKHRIAGVILGLIGVAFLATGQDHDPPLPDSTVVLNDSLAQDDSTMISADSLSSGELADSPGQGVLTCPGRPDTIVNNAFGLGEQLVFKIKYAGITAGISTIEVADTVRIDGHLCYRIDNRTQSTETFSVFYKVDDRAASWFDVDQFVSRRFEKHLREGDFRADAAIEFDQESGIARYPLKKGEPEVEVPPCVLDVFAAIFYVRLLPLEIGQDVVFDNHDNKKTYPLVVKVLKKELIKVEAGVFQCIKVQPLLRTPGLFEHKGDLWVWLTDDEYHMPVLMKSKVAVGSVNAELAEYTLGTPLHHE